MHFSISSCSVDEYLGLEGHVRSEGHDFRNAAFEGRLAIFQWTRKVGGFSKRVVIGHGFIKQFSVTGSVCAVDLELRLYEEFEFLLELMKIYLSTTAKTMFFKQDVETVAISLKHISSSDDITRILLELGFDAIKGETMFLKKYPKNP